MAGKETKSLGRLGIYTQESSGLEKDVMVVIIIFPPGTQDHVECCEGAYSEKKVSGLNFQLVTCDPKLDEDRDSEGGGAGAGSGFNYLVFLNHKKQPPPRSLL